MIGFDSSLGIEIKETSLNMACLEKSLEGWTLKHFENIPLPAPAEYEERQKVIIDSISDFRRKSSFTSSKVFVSIPREYVLFKYIRLPQAAKENLSKVIEYEMERFVPFGSDEVFFDFQIVREFESVILVLLAAVKRAILQPYLDIFLLASSEPLSVEVSSTALFNALANSDETFEEGDFAVFLIDSGRAELLVAMKGVLAYSRAFSLSDGGSAVGFTKILKELETALFQISNDFCAGEEIKPESLKYVLLSNDDKTITDVKEILDKEGLDCRIGFKPLRLRNVRTNFQSVAVPYGAALKGLKKVPLSIDLMPKGKKQTVKPPSWIPTAILAVLVAFLGISWGSIFVNREREQLADLNTRVEKLKPEIRFVEQLEKQVQALEKNYKAFENFKAGNVSQLDILRELTSIIPEKVYLTRFNYAGGKVQIEGQAPSASELIPILETSPLFQEAKFSAPITKTPEGMEQFRLEAGIEQKQPEKAK